ncbi:hypothetical protein CROQUDRAFT_87213 [Cronartium quercuum f. sp. fusiforme G11]|uniref:Uncharacterized protein n=1 Tax=Cronartium quercuum f. sp. fusiforme G11 TaxID=708437 RepID=A0A9P6NT14_9BASI|nr:hypothetical protein CROQUDRAFT_87213 [Cronartium quercuum f. sp. fusiforme G11]
MARARVFRSRPENLSPREMMVCTLSSCAPLPDTNDNQQAWVQKSVGLSGSQAIDWGSPLQIVIDGQCIAYHQRPNSSVDRITTLDLRLFMCLLFLIQFESFPYLYSKSNTPQPFQHSTQTMRSYSHSNASKTSWNRVAKASWDGLLAVFYRLCQVLIFLPLDSSSPQAEAQGDTGHGFDVTTDEKGYKLGGI